MNITSQNPKVTDISYSETYLVSEHRLEGVRLEVESQQGTVSGKKKK